MTPNVLTCIMHAQSLPPEQTEEKAMPSHRNDGRKVKKEVVPFGFVPSEKGKRRATEEKGAAGE